MENSFDWYIKLMNFLCEKATDGKLLNRTEIWQLNHCIDKNDFADSINELIHDIADANDCGKCESWNDIIKALSEQIKNGERM